MKPIRVLVVDDSALMRQMISRILTDAGMEVVATARDGIDGLEKVAKLPSGRRHPRCRDAPDGRA